MRTISPAVNCGNTIHRLCRRKSRSHFGHGFSTGKSTGGIRLPVEKMCGYAVGRGLFPSHGTGSAYCPQARGTGPPGRQANGRNRSNEPRAVRPVGYDSRVCSTTGDAIERIAAAIDQLASDARDAEGARGAAGQRELRKRVACLWEMISDLDPELARRARRYTAPADDGPSS
jgi:hypothetical protein